MRVCCLIELGEIHWIVNLVDLVKSCLHPFSTEICHSNEYLVVKPGFNTAENESLKVRQELGQREY